MNRRPIGGYLLKPVGLLAGALVIVACGREPTPAEPAPSPEPASRTVAEVAPIDVFLANIAGHCGQAFAGRIVANEPAQDDDAFEGKPLVMHVRECGSAEIRVPFHVGEDRSRTWVLTRTPEGLRLKHDHRHEDGSDDELTQYGGDTVAPGSANRQVFPVDAGSIELFERLGYSASISNAWAIEIEPGARFLYELSRPGGRLFQVEFDLTTPVEPPPAPWGDE